MLGCFIQVFPLFGKNSTFVMLLWFLIIYISLNKFEHYCGFSNGHAVVLRFCSFCVCDDEYHDNHKVDDHNHDKVDDDDGHQLVVVAEQVVIESLGIWVATVHLIIILFDYTIYRVVFFHSASP